MKNLIRPHFFYPALLCLLYHVPCHGAELVFLENNLKIVQEAVPPATKPAATSPSLTEWIATYKNRSLESPDFSPTVSGKPDISREEQIAYITKLTQIQTAALQKFSSEVAKALGSTDQNTDFLFIEKIVADAPCAIYFCGDIHGDIAALVHFLQKLKTDNVIDDDWTLKPDNTYVIMGGDYMDHGAYSLEVLATLSLLKQNNREKEKNGQRIFFLRGNHEEIHLNKDKTLNEKIDTRYGAGSWEKTFMGPLKNLYDSLPCALFVGIPTTNNKTSYIQFCHGGFDLYDIELFLNTEDHAAEQIVFRENPLQYAIYQLKLSPEDFRTKQDLRNLSDLYIREWSTTTEQGQQPGKVAEINAKNLQLLWADFTNNKKSKYQNYTDGSGARSMMWGSGVLKKFFAYWSEKQNQIVAIFRAHQHDVKTMPELFSPKASNVYRLKNFPVFTTVCSTGYTKQDTGKAMMPNRGFLVLDLKKELAASYLTKYYQTPGTEDWKSELLKLDLAF